MLQALVDRARTKDGECGYCFAPSSHSSWCLIRDAEMVLRATRDAG